MIHDFRLAVRMLWRSPGFALVAVLSLGLGIGANTVIFGVFNALFLKTLPGKNPEELVSVYTGDYSGPRYGTSSYPDYVDLRSRNQSLSGLATYMPMPGVLTLPDRTERAYGEFVSPDYFQVLGVLPVVGQPFGPDEESVTTARRIVVISDRMWRRQLQGSPSVIGSEIRLNGQVLTVSGVAPPGFQGMLRGFAPDFWVPMTLIPVLQPGSQEDLTNRGSRSHFIIGRIRSGFDIEQVQADLSVQAARLFEEHPNAWTNVRREARPVTVVPESGSRVLPMIQGPVLGFIGFLLAVVGLVLLVACANLANLLLARASARTREMAIRISVGAGRRRLVRQLLTESVVVSLSAGVAGLGLALVLDRAIRALEPPLPLPVSIDNSIDARVMLFLLGVSVATGILFGLLPALQSTRRDVATGLRRDASPSRPGRVGLRGSMVAAQMALSVVLLLGAGLFMRSLQNAHAVDPGFDPENLVMMSVDLETQGYTLPESRAFFGRALAALRESPGVAGATLSEVLDLGIGGQRRGMSIEGYARQDGEDTEVSFNRVGPDYFRTMKIPVLRGRGITDADIAGAPGVVVVNEAFVQRFWPSTDPMGRRVSLSGDDGPWLDVVGVARDGKYRTLGEDPLPFVFVAMLQEERTSASFVVRTSGPPERFRSTLPAVLTSLDPALPVFDIKTGTEHMGIALLPARVAGSLLGTFGILALLLAAIGIYGIMAYVVSRRTREMGIRSALGADRGVLMRQMLGLGLRSVAAGLILGTIAAAGLTRFASAFLYGVSPLDPWIFTIVPLILGAVALVACLVPVQRALRTGPAAALRAD